MNARALRGRCALLGLAILAIGSSPAGADDTGTKIYLNGVKSSVLVFNLDRRSQGSGSVINLRDGYVLTNWHVVREGTDMFIMFPLWEKGRPVAEDEKYKAQIRKIGLPGKVVASDSKVDLAIIKLEEPAKIPQGTLSVKFAPDSPLPGAKLHSIGNPGASDGLWIYTPGEVRSVYRKKWASGANGKLVAEHDAKVIEATSATNPGDSGGPCFNDKGEQVGVTQGGLRSTVAQGFSFFIDATDVRDFLKSKKIAFNVANDVASVAPPMKDPETKIDAPPKKEDEELARQEKLAGSMLNQIRLVAKDPSKKGFVIENLDKLIKMYPKSAAAKDAREMLGKLK